MLKKEESAKVCEKLMKKIKVIVKEKNILEICEDAQKGDIIDLEELVEVDTSYIDSLIQNKKDKAISEKIEEFKKISDQQKEIEVAKYKNDIELLKKENETQLLAKTTEVRDKFNQKVSELNQKVEILESTRKLELDAIKVNYENQIQSLYQEIESINKNHEISLQLKEKEVSSKFSDKINVLENKLGNITKEKNDVIETLNKENDIKIQNALLQKQIEFNEKIKEKDDIINNLQRAKSSMNVKQTGEDLEAWCNNEVSSYMQNGFLNCKWSKDNQVVKDDGESKGSKADFIFEIYESDKHNRLLSKICMDMKDENPDSVNKKSNADYYKQLDKNREKKGCEYSILVSNLEMDKPNVLPIFKVRDYENMYVVRPAYLMVFLNMIVSLTTKFSNLLLANEKESIVLQKKFDLIAEFDSIKNTYLDKPLEDLEKNIDGIIKSSETIRRASNLIDEQCEKIKAKYIFTIKEKIDKFGLKLDKKIINNLVD